MSYGDPNVKEAPPESAAAVVQRERSKLRSFLVEPGNPLQLVTVSEHLWLTDTFVLLDMTGNPVVTGIQDGEYHLTLIRGLESSGDHPRHVAPEIAEYLAWLTATKEKWVTVHPTTVSLRREDHDLLVYTEVFSKVGEFYVRTPATIDGETWQAWHTAYQDNPKETRKVFFEKQPGMPNRPFRILLQREHNLPEVVGYQQPVAIPDGIRPDGSYNSKDDLRSLAQHIVDNWKG